MTIGAGSDTVLGELLAVNVFVAILTLGWRSRKVGGDQLRLHVGRFVAIDAGSRAVRPNQRE